MVGEPYKTTYRKWSLNIIAVRSNAINSREEPARVVSNAVNKNMYFQISLFNY